MGDLNPLPPHIDYRAVREGQCPHGHGPLERRDDCGWCDECGWGWSVAGNVVSTHLEFNTEPLQAALDRAAHADAAGFKSVTRLPPASTA